MSVMPQMMPLEINSDKKRKIILENTIRMLTNRKLLNSNNLDTNINNITSIDSDESLYTIKLDSTHFYYPENQDNRVMYVKILQQKITGVSKSSTISEFLNQYKNSPKIIIVSSISTAAYDTIRGDYPYSEIFQEKDLMIDKIRHITVPPHELLSDTDTKKVLDEYLVKKKQMPRIFVTDPISKYYNAKVGQIFRITRPSETSGIAPYHRIVVNGNIMKQ